MCFRVNEFVKRSPTEEMLVYLNMQVHHFQAKLQLTRKGNSECNEAERKRVLSSN